MSSRQEGGLLFFFFFFCLNDLSRGRSVQKRRISFRELVDVATFDKESKVEDFQQPSTCCLLHPG